MNEIVGKLEKDVLLISIINCKGYGNKKTLNCIVKNNYNVDSIYNQVSAEVGAEYFNILYNNIKKIISDQEEKGIKMISIMDEKYPQKLIELNDPVIYLFYKGDISLLYQNSVAIVGSRQASIYGLEKACLLGKEFCKEGIPVVNGLAIGVDAEVMKSTVKENGKAIAVLPSSLDNIIPKKNEKIAVDILKKGGCLISEYSIGSKVDKYCYVKRDRIQSAVSNVLIVVEAKEDSGTMYAVKESLSLQKMVYQYKHNTITIIENKFEISEDKIKEIVNIINKPRGNEQLSLF